MNDTLYDTLNDKAYDIFLVFFLWHIAQKNHQIHQRFAPQFQSSYTIWTKVASELSTHYTYRSWLSIETHTIELLACSFSTDVNQL